MMWDTNRSGGRDSRLTRTQTEPYQWTGTGLDIPLIDVNNNCPSLVWWSLSTELLSRNKPLTFGIGIVTHLASFSPRSNTAANRSFSSTLLFPRVAKVIAPQPLLNELLMLWTLLLHITFICKEKSYTIWCSYTVYDSFNQVLSWAARWLESQFSQGLCGFAGFLPQSKDMQTGVRLIGDSKLTVVLKWEWIVVCLYFGLALRWLPLAQCQLELAPANPRSISGTDGGMDYLRSGVFNRGSVAPWWSATVLQGVREIREISRLLFNIVKNI